MRNYDLSTDEGMANAITWTTTTLSALKDGGTWIVPRSMTIVTAWPSKKEFHIYDGKAPDPAIRRVLFAMGWSEVQGKGSSLKGGLPL